MDTDEKPVQTEVPNALLLLMLKKPAQNGNKGKAKAKAKGKAKAAGKAKAKAKATGVSFVKMYYLSGYAALRYSGGGSQLFHFGGTNYKTADLYEILDMAIAELKSKKLAPEEAKDFCFRQLEQLEG